MTDRVHGAPGRGTPRVDPTTFGPPGPEGPVFSSIEVDADYTATPEFRVIVEIGALPPAGLGERTLLLPAAPVLDEEYYAKDWNGVGSEPDRSRRQRHPD